MARTSHPVFRAIRRWEEKGLLPPHLANNLRDETREEFEVESRRWSQYLLAATGGAVLVIAGSTFLAWAWPAMGPAGQSLTLAVIGLGIFTLGVRLPGVGRWVPVAYLLQVSGPVLVFMGLIHSREAWADGSAGGVAVGVAGLLVALGALGVALRRDPGLAGLQAAMAFLFVYGFFDRATVLGDEPILWILDGILVLALAFLGYRLEDPDGPEWALPMFAACAVTGFVLLAFSGEIAWDLDAFTILPMDVWLILVAGLAFWGLQDGAPPHLRRDWFEKVLALCVLAGIPFGFITTLEALDTPPEPAALTVGGVGGVGLWYGLARGSRPVLVAACVALLIAAWYYGAEKAGALGSVLALGVMAALLFWGATRVGRPVPGGAA